MDRYQRRRWIPGGGSFPLIEEFFDSFRNEDGMDLLGGDCDKFIEDGLDCSINANTYWIASPR
jgi:hypothetical protein